MPQFCLSFEALTSLLASTLNFSKLAAQIPTVHWPLSAVRLTQCTEQGNLRVVGGVGCGVTNGGIENV